MHEILTNPALIPLLAFAASWGGARASLNGTRKRVEKIDDKVDSIDRRLSRMEGKFDVEPAD